MKPEQLDERYTMLIVDDEHEIREGLKQVDYAAFNIEVLAVCDNGIEALKAMEETPADILLTDIKMPLMDGLELISKVSAMYPYTKKIVLSGYGDFEYAKKGIEFGVLDYLLKPLDFEEYLHILRKTTEMLGEEREKQLKQASLERKAKLTAHRLRTKFLSELLQRSLTEESIELESAAAEVMLEPGGPYAVCVLRMESYPQRPKPVSDAEWQLVVFALDNLLQDYWDERGFGYHYVDPVTAQCALIVTDASLLSEGEGEGGGDRTAQAGFGNGNGNQQKAGKSIEAGLDVMIKALKRFRGLFQSHLHYRTGPVVHQASAIHRSFLIAESKFADDPAALHDDAAEEPRLLQSAEEAELGQAGGNRLVEAAKDFIADHYDRTITLDDVAQHVHLNTSYLSYLFKEMTGKKYIDYLTELRMNKARKLLEDTNWKIYEVGEMVGYENPRYFTLLFKKMMGQSPQEYRNAHYHSGRQGRSI